MFKLLPREVVNSDNLLKYTFEKHLKSYATNKTWKFQPILYQRHWIDFSIIFEMIKVTEKIIV